MIFVLLGLICVLLVFFAKRGDWLGPALCFYCGLSILVFGVSVMRGSPISDMGSIVAFIDFSPSFVGAEMSTALFMTAWCVVALVSAGRSNHSSKRVLRLPAWFLWSLLGACVVSLVVITSSVGVSNLWASYGYGVIKDADVLFGSTLERAVASFSRLFSVGVCVLFVMAISRNQQIFVLASGTAVVWSVLLAVAQSSRMGGVFMLIISACALQRSFKLFAAATFLLGVLFSLVALEARAHSVQGLSSFFAYASLALDRDGALLEVFLSLLGAMFATSGTATVAAPDAYPVSYKLLSLSPTIDLLDGFRDLKDRYEQRMAIHIPFNAFGEIFSFGAIYMFLYWFSLYIATVCCQALAKRGVLLYWCSMGILLQGLVLASQYPVRNGLRYFHLVVVIWLVARLMDRGKLRHSFGGVSRGRAT